MAEMTVIRSNGQEVKMVLGWVDRVGRQVTVRLPGYNAQFVFSDRAGRVVLTVDGRQVIDSTRASTTHVSRSVYRQMAMWAGSILNDRRD